jgi:hypothetical protein
MPQPQIVTFILSNCLPFLIVDAIDALISIVELKALLAFVLSRGFVASACK